MAIGYLTRHKLKQGVFLVTGDNWAAIEKDGELKTKHTISLDNTAVNKIECVNKNTALLHFENKTVLLEVFGEAITVRNSEGYRMAITTEYQAYLSSTRWKSKRRKVLRRAGYKCERCHKQQATQIHHLTYERIFHERLSDLQAVCGLCHMEIHEIEPEKPKRKKVRLFGLKRVLARIIG